MLEWIVLDRAPFFPHTCVGCTSPKGPLLDTHREVGNTGLRVYLCQDCIKRGARLLGFAKGERMNELASANEMLMEREREVANLLKEVSALTANRAAEAERAEALVQTLSDREAYIANLETRMRGVATDALASVAD